MVKPKSHIPSHQVDGSPKPWRSPSNSVKRPNNNNTNREGYCSYGCVSVGCILCKTTCLQDVVPEVCDILLQHLAHLTAVFEKLFIYGKFVNCAWGFKLLQDITVHNLWRTYLKHSNSKSKEICFCFI